MSIPNDLVDSRSTLTDVVTEDRTKGRLYSIHIYARHQRSVC